MAGIIVTLDGGAPQDRTPPDDRNAIRSPPGSRSSISIRVEVVQRIGYDSFTPDNGVLLAKNKNGEGNTCGYNCFTWVIDAHPEDIHMLDFRRPNGEPVMRTIADYRQLNDALFHAGLDSGSQYEWEDTPNRLHFYVVDVHKDARGILSYTLGVRSLDGAGSETRGVSISARGCAFTIANTGAAPPGTDAVFDSDIYRLSVSVDGQGWSAQLRNSLAAVRFGESQTVPVYVTRGAVSAQTVVVTLKAQSESDPSKSASASCTPL